MIRNLLPFTGIQCTINTTENCNLACKYCYEINKKTKSISLETAKKFIDVFLEDPDPMGVKGTENEWMLLTGINLDFIGGDSLIDPQLLDNILRYFQYKLRELNHPAKDNWRASISTNGTLFAREDVRAFCEKWREVLAVGVSIDGSPTIHDKNRVFPDGSPTMAVIEEWLPWYQSMFFQDGQSTKATCSRDSIPYLYESLVYMHEKLGLRYINQNFIMEDMSLTEEDIKLLDSQLEKCVDYVVEHRDELYWSPLDKATFADHHRSQGDDWSKQGKCGSGSMIAVSPEGKMYPCFRWLPHSQPSNLPEMVVGNVTEGFTSKEVFAKVRENSFRERCTLDPKCIDCEYESACSYCIAGGYAEYGEFRRPTHICEVTKLQCKWAKTYWNKVGILERGVAEYET